MSGNICKLRSEITRRDIEAGIRRAHSLRSQFVAAALSGAVKRSIKGCRQIGNVISGALRRDPLSLSPTGNPSSSPAFWKGAAEKKQRAA